MVFFTCNGCGESLKKAQVEKHMVQCRKSSAGFDCVDCLKTFTTESYVDHTSCITEEQKYGGKDFVAKVPKGQAKQQSWIEQVHSAIEKVDPKEKHLREVLNKLTSYTNIPRKEKPFKNFLSNSFGVRQQPDLPQKIWDLIAAAAKPVNADNNTQTNDEHAKPNKQKKHKKKEKNPETDEATEEKPETSQIDVAVAESKSKKKKKKRKLGGAAFAQEQETSMKKQKVEENGQTETHEALENGASHSSLEDVPFKWKSAMKTVIKATPETKIKKKKLLARVLKQFRATVPDCDVSDDVVRQFLNQKIEKAFVLEGNVVTLKKD